MDMRQLSGRRGSKLPRHRFGVIPKLCGYLCRYRGKCLLNSARNAAGFTGLAK